MSLPRFRVWEPQYKVLGLGTFIMWLDTDHVEVDFLGNNNEPKRVDGEGIIVEVSTGEVDVDGTEIFEGDIVVCDVRSDGQERAVKNQRGPVVKHGLTWGLASWGGEWCHNIKVVGNIHGVEMVRP